MEKTCITCETSKDIDDFGMKGKYRSSYCRPCETARRIANRRANGRNDCPVKAKIRQIRYNQKDREDRADNKRLAYFVLHDCRGGDRKKGRECDLDRNFVQQMIEQPCSYCGLTSKTAKITLDRIDNSIGHMKTNVVTSCYRCNLMRSDMPHSAWMLLVPVIRATMESGAFGDWKLHPTRRVVNPIDISVLETQIPQHANETKAKGKYQKVSDEDFIKALREHPSICKALTALGLAPKGKNYTRAKRLLGYGADVRLSTNGKISPR